MTAYFQKTDADQRVLLSSGKWFTFKPRQDSIATVVRGPSPKIALVQTDNGWLAEEFRKCIVRGVGGIKELGKAEFEEAKKKLSLMTSRPVWREELRASDFNRVQRKKDGDAAADKKKAAFAAHIGENHMDVPSARLPVPKKVLTDFTPATSKR